MVHPGTSVAWHGVKSGQAGARVKIGRPGRGRGARRVKSGKSAPGCGAARGVKFLTYATIGEQGSDTRFSQKWRAGKTIIPGALSTRGKVKNKKPIGGRSEGPRQKGCRSGRKAKSRDGVRPSKR